MRESNPLLPSETLAATSGMHNCDVANEEIGSQRISIPTHLYSFIILFFPLIPKHCISTDKARKSGQGDYSNIPIKARNHCPQFLHAPFLSFSLCHFTILAYCYVF